MRGPIMRVLILTLSSVLLRSPLESQDTVEAEDPIAVNEEVSEAAPETDVSPVEGGAAPVPPGVSEVPSPRTDRYPATIDNLAGRGLLNLLDPFPLAQLHLQLPVDTLRVMKEGDGEHRVQPQVGQ